MIQQQALSSRHRFTPPTEGGASTGSRPDMSSAGVVDGPSYPVSNLSIGVQSAVLTQARNEHKHEMKNFLDIISRLHNNSRGSDILMSLNTTRPNLVSSA